MVKFQKMHQRVKGGQDEAWDEEYVREKSSGGRHTISR